MATVGRVARPLVFRARRLGCLVELDFIPFEPAKNSWARDSIHASFRDEAVPLSQKPCTARARGRRRQAY